MRPGWAIAVLLVGLAVFGFLRARTVVADTWGIRSGRNLVALGAVVLAVALLVAVARSLAGVVIGAAILGVALYAAWRLPRT